MIRDAMMTLTKTKRRHLMRCRGGVGHREDLGSDRVFKKWFSE